MFSEIKIGTPEVLLLLCAIALISLTVYYILTSDGGAATIIGVFAIACGLVAIKNAFPPMRKKEEYG